MRQCFFFALLIVITSCDRWDVLLFDNNSSSEIGVIIDHNAKDGIAETYQDSYYITIPPFSEGRFETMSKWSREIMDSVHFYVLKTDLSSSIVHRTIRPEEIVKVPEEAFLSRITYTHEDAENHLVLSYPVPEWIKHVDYQ